MLDISKLRLTQPQVDLELGLSLAILNCLKTSSRSYGWVGNIDIGNIDIGILTRIVKLCYTIHK
jgi:hypothetical protein